MYLFDEITMAGRLHDVDGFYVEALVGSDDEGEYSLDVYATDGAPYLVYVRCKDGKCKLTEVEVEVVELPSGLIAPREKEGGVTDNVVHVDEDFTAIVEGIRELNPHK